MPKIITKVHNAKLNENGDVELLDEGTIKEELDETVQATEEASVGDQITRMAQAVNAFNTKQKKVAQRVWNSDRTQIFKVKQQSIIHDTR